MLAIAPLPLKYFRTDLVRPLQARPVHRSPRSTSPNRVTIINRFNTLNARLGQIRMHCVIELVGTIRPDDSDAIFDDLVDRQILHCRLLDYFLILTCMPLKIGPRLLFFFAFNHTKITTADVFHGATTNTRTAHGPLISSSPLHVIRVVSLKCCAEARKKMKPHLLLFPFPGQGHIIPMLDLAHSLACEGLAVTLLTTPRNEPLLHSLLSTASSLGLDIQPLVLPLPPTDGLPPQSENIAQLHLHLIPKFIYSYKELAHPIEQWFHQQQLENNGDFGPPVCMISDFFLGWTQDTAAKLGIPRVVFYPSGAFAISIIYSLWKHLPHEGVESDEAKIHIPEFPHPLTFLKSRISPLVRMYKRSDPVSEFVRYSMNLNFKSWGSVFNTFDDLESLYLHHIEKVSGRSVWSVGPLLPSDVLQGKHELNVVRRGNPNSINESTCLQWLDSRKEKSVIYICFGSLAALSNKQIDEVAAGLEASEESFVWVMKNPPQSRISENAHEYGGILPQGFEERTKERGLVIRGWAPQLLILSHPSVGGFLSHCGWNSVLESVTLGVPLIAWPMSADQYSNALLLVDYLGVGVRLCEGPTALPTRDDLKTAVRRVIGREGEEAKRAEELSEAARMAVQGGGSSWKNLKGFVSEMKKLASSR